MDQTAEGNFVTETPEMAARSSSKGAIEVMDSNENAVEVMSNLQSKYMMDMAGNAKQKDKTNEMTVVTVSERKSLKRKVVHPPTSEMVMDSIKALKKRNGASFEDIRKYMEEKYVIDMRFLKHHVDNFLQKSVDNGVLEKIDGGRAGGRFKIKKSEISKKDFKKLPPKEGKMKAEKKMDATKKQVKK